MRVAARGRVVLLVALARAARITYVTSTWWPKIDGACVAMMGHVRHFAAEGHDVLVVRPVVPAIMWRDATNMGDAVDPLPASERLAFVDFATIPGSRAGGYELVIDPLGFAEAEAAIVSFAPDVLLVADPDLFMFDAFRLPGFNSMASFARPPVTIACFTTFLVDAVFKMPDFVWCACGGHTRERPPCCGEPHTSDRAR